MSVSRTRLLPGCGLVVLLPVAALAAVSSALLPDLDQPITTTPADHGLPHETVSIRVDAPAISLVAWWIPAERPRGVAVLLHDGSSNRGFVWTRGLGLAAGLHARGYHVLTPDLRGHGDSDVGDIRVPVGREVASDVSAWIDFARGRAGDLPVVLVGFGLGGQVAIYAAAEDDRIVAVVADSTWADLRSSLALTIPANTALPAAVMPALLWSGENLHGVDFAASRAVEVVSRLRSRLLLVQNEADSQVPIRHLRWLASRAGDAEVWITPAPLPDHPLYAERGSWGTHTQSYALYPDAYTRRVAQFFERKIQAR